LFCPFNVDLALVEHLKAENLLVLTTMSLKIINNIKKHKMIDV